MKKNLFFLFVAASVAMMYTACSSYEEEIFRGDEPVTLAEPENASDAAAFEIPESAVTTTDGASLTAVNFTEGGRAVFEVTTADGSKKYATYSVTVEGNKYLVKDESGRSVGQVEVGAAASAPRRAAGDASLTIDITITIPGVGILTFATANPVAATQVAQEIAATTNSVNIARTWTVKTMKIVLEGDVDLAKTERSGNLKVFADAAQEEGANLTADEMKALSKTIQRVTIDKTGLFSIEYADGGSEACTWSWNDSNQTQIALQLKNNTEFGNKFLTDNSYIRVDFSPAGCAFTLTTNITGSKNYKATLTIVLE